MAGILQRKASLRVGLHGSYRPAAESKRLESLKSSIEREGYSSAQLVRDTPDLPEFKADGQLSTLPGPQKRGNLQD